MAATATVMQVNHGSIALPWLPLVETNLDMCLFPLPQHDRRERRRDQKQRWQIHSARAFAAAARRP